MCRKLHVGRVNAFYSEISCAEEAKKRGAAGEGDAIVFLYHVFGKSIKGVGIASVGKAEIKPVLGLRARGLCDTVEYGDNCTVVGFYGRCTT